MTVQLDDIAPIPPAQALAQLEEARRRKRDRQQRLGETRRGLVLDAARAVFLELGFDGANIREIARRAGYTPGAIYSYFENKEAIYATLMEETLERLRRAIVAIKPTRGQPDRTFVGRAAAWLRFFSEHPRDLDLGLYLIQGSGHKGLGAGGVQRHNELLLDALRPCEEALLAMGLDAATARQEHTALFALGLGLLSLQRSGRMSMFEQDALTVFEQQLETVVQRHATRIASVSEDLDVIGQGDLFGEG